MHVHLARTFLEIVATGSFLNAAKRLYVTQSAVSLRVKKLEEELGQTLFVRTKAGAELTHAGSQFERYAHALVRIWENARYQIAVPEGFDDTLILGSQYSLWPRLGQRWLRTLEDEMPRIALRAEIGMPDRLIRMMLDGMLDAALMYTPQLRPGLSVELLLEDTLVLVAPDPGYGPTLDRQYVLIDWGPEFIAAHKYHFPDFGAARTTLALGSVALDFVIAHNRAAYFPTRIVEAQLEAGNLHVIAGAPALPFRAYVVAHTEKDPQLLERSLSILRRVAARIDDRRAEILDDARVVEDGTGMAGQIASSAA